MQKPKSNTPSLWALLKPYQGLVALLAIFGLVSNGANLILPKLIAKGIDSYTFGTFVLSSTVGWFLLASMSVFVSAYLQTIVQTYASERVARDLRRELSAKISRQSYLYVQTVNPAKLLTNLTGDIDSVKLFVSQAIASIISSACIIVGASILLLMINWKLALAVLAILPIIATVFFVVLGRVRALFKQSREIIDRLNKVINESIVGAALIRVLHSQKLEGEKFTSANAEAKNLGLKILAMFAGMIPVITFLANSAALIILVLGGHFVISGSMTLGSFAAFSSYLAMLIFPIFVIGFMSNIIAQATTSYQRVQEVLQAPEDTPTGTLVQTLQGAIEMNHVELEYADKKILKDVSIKINGGTKTAIIGPTAAGKTQLLYLLTGLTKPDKGVITFDGQPVETYDLESLHKQIGFVFQDSIIFNMSLRENIAFSSAVTDASLEKALATAELTEFVAELPEHLNTIVSERGASLSGGQKQRIMLARALALDPKILLLDDFTARVDSQTEQTILANITKNYPDLTLLSITQKISSIEQYDQIIVLMEGEVLDAGTHTELLERCPEYVQIYQSQRSTSSYELHA